jgi:hypothetical protein
MARDTRRNRDCALCVIQSNPENAVFMAYSDPRSHHDGASGGRPD